MTPPLLLLVDDAPDVAVMVRWLSRRAGHEVVCCADATAAWQYLQETMAGRRPDLLLLDLNLPGVSGWDLCKRLRADANLAGLRIALLSQWDRIEDVAAGLEAGADCVVCKDLLAQPEAWPERIQEVLLGPGAVPVEGLRPGVLYPAPEVVLQTLHQLLRQPLLRSLGSRVVTLLVQRSLERLRAGGLDPAGGALPNPQDWLAPEGNGLDVKRLTGSCRPDGVVLFALTLWTEIELVLGGAATAPLREALARVLPPLLDFPGRGTSNSNLETPSTG